MARTSRLAGAAMVGAALLGCGGGSAGTESVESLGSGLVSATWSTPVLAERAGGRLDYPAVAWLADGSALAVWTRGDGSANSPRFNVWSNRWSAQTGFGTMQQVNAVAPEPYYYSTTFKPELATDRFGNAMVAWPQYNGSWRDLWVNRYDATTGWAAAELIAGLPGGVGEPAWAVGKDGSFWLAFRQYEPNGIWVRHYQLGSGWSTATRIDAGPGSSDGLSLGIDAAGNVTLAWAEYAFGGDGSVWTARYEPETGWHLPVRHSNYPAPGNTFGVWVGVAPSGTARLIYRGQDGSLVWRSYSDSGWSAESVLFAASHYTYRLAAGNARGQALVLSRSDDTWYSRFFDPESGWSAEAKSERTREQWLPRLSLDDTGNGILTYSDSPVPNTWAINAALFDPCQGFESPQTVQSNLPGVGSYTAAAHGAVRGKSAAVVWDQYDGLLKDDVWASFGNRRAEGFQGSSHLRSLAEGLTSSCASPDNYEPNSACSGEHQMELGSQQIALMTRPLAGAVCQGAPGYQQNALGLQAITVLQSDREQDGVDAAYGEALPRAGAQDCVGLSARNGLGPYGALRLIYGGSDLDADGLADGTPQACDSPERRQLVKDWAQLTRQSCRDGGNPLHHAFRAGDGDDLTVAFKRRVGISQFCNGGQLDDLDPIRRACLPGEQVCAPDGTLGLVLPIAVDAGTTYPAISGTAQSRYPSFYRLHQSASNVTTGDSAVRPCVQTDSTRQVGCLVSQSPYSLGIGDFVGSRVPGVTFLKIANVAPTRAAVRSGSYPLTERVFVNTLVGNANVTGSESNLLACLLDRSTIDPLLSEAGLFTFSDSPTDGAEATFQTQTCGAGSVP